MGGKKKPKVEIVGMVPDMSALVINHLIATGLPQIATLQPLMDQLLFRSNSSISSATSDGTFDELSAQSSSLGSRPVKQIVAKNKPHTLLRQDTHSTSSTESDDESDIDTFLDYAQAVIAEKSLRYDTASFRDFESKLSRSIRSHFLDSEDECDSLTSASSYSGYSVDEIMSYQSDANSLMASETSSCRQNGRVIARKKTWTKLTGNRTQRQDEVSIKTEDAWENVERTVDDLIEFALITENDKGGILPPQLSPGSIRRVSPSKHDSPHPRHHIKVKKAVSEDGRARQGFKFIAGPQDYRHDMPQAASPSISHGIELAFDDISSPAPDAQDEAPSDDEEIVSEETLRAAPHRSFQNRLRTGHENEDAWLVGDENLFYASSSPTLSIDASKDEESGGLGRNAPSSPNAKTILDVDDTEIIDSRLGAMPATYDDDSDSVARRYEQISRYLTGESLDRQISLSIDDSAEHGALPDLSFSTSASSEEMLSLSLDDAASEIISIDDGSIEQTSAAFSFISVDSGSQNVISRHVELGTISEDPHDVMKGWDLDEMVETFLVRKIETLTKKLNSEKDLEERVQALSKKHDHVNKPEEMISSQPLNTNLSSKSSNEKMQSDEHSISNNQEPHLNDISGDSDFAIFPRQLNTACLSVELSVQRIEQKLSFDEELHVKGRDLIRRIKEKRKGRIISDLKGRVFDPIDRVQRSKDSPPSPRKSEVARSSPESHLNERSRVVKSTDGRIDIVQRPKDPHSSSRRKSGLTLLPSESQSTERPCSNLSEMKTDLHREHGLVSVLTTQNRAPRSPHTVSKPRRKKSKRNKVVLDMACLSSPKSKNLEHFHESVDEWYEDRQEKYQKSNRTSSASPEMIFTKGRTRYDDGDELKRGRPDSHNEFESSIPCPLKSPTKTFGVKNSCVDYSSPSPMLQSTPDSSGNRPRGRDDSFLASAPCSRSSYLSPPSSPESPIGEFNMRMVEEASEYNYELPENSIVSTGSSNNRKERRGKGAFLYSQSPESFHRTNAEASSYACPPAITFNDSFDDIVRRHHVEESDPWSDLKQGQRRSPTSVFDWIEPAKDPFVQRSSKSLIFRDHITSGSLAFADDEQGDLLFLDDDDEGDLLFLDDDKHIWASHSIVGYGNNALPTNSLNKSEYCPPGVGKKTYREYGMLNPNRFEF
jgi:hypothetical protein